MGKALVIKGVNFSTNKLATDLISDVIPCTGLSLSMNTITFVAVGATQTLIATVTPNNTTDTLEWISSNENCATVENGVVTCVGVGTATITAICGEQTATCSVVSSVTVVAENVYSILHASTFTNNSSRDYFSMSSPGAGSTRARTLFADGNPLDGYKAISIDNETTNTLYPAVLPKNCTKIIAARSDNNVSSLSFGFLNANKLTEYNLSSSAKGAKAYPPIISGSFSENEIEIDISEVNSDANSFIFYEYFKSGVDESETSTKVTLTFE